MDDRILWRGLTPVHDWRDGLLLSRLIDRAATIGLIGPSEWRRTKFHGARKAFTAEPGNLARGLLGRPIGVDEIVSVEAGGSQPAPWALSAFLPPFDAELNRIRGISVISLLFGGASLLAHGKERSDDLIDAFAAVHTIDDTEFAFIHPYRRWAELGDTTYEKAITTSPMLAGVYWANFLGPDHLGEFDRTQLSDLSAYRVDWVDDRGLYLVVGPTLADATLPATEAEMKRLSEVFRAALVSH